ncbi:MAG: LON peptidase substrate-binding domain-containing protein [Thiotrichaceae bacterium]|nr:LON peptidase substrate-binding domain-containing protein [Thiotrichaceae bacterium]
MNNKKDQAVILKALPIFPLKSVLFPDGALSLKVFESRYLDMLGQCERNETGFGICLISDGSEVGPAPEIFSFGTLVQITYWENRKDGLLGVSVKGQQKFKVKKKYIYDNELVVADVELLDMEAELLVPEQYQAMVDVLKKILSALQHPYITLPKKYEDSCWVGSRLSELLPISILKKQQLLELSEPMGRLAMLYDEMLNLGMLSE